MALLNDLTLTLIFSRLLAFLIVIGVHGFACAWLLGLMGDDTPKYNDRRTANPVPHGSMLALVAAVFFQTFWIKPMKIGFANLRWGRWSMVIVALGSLAMTLALVPILEALKPLLILNLPRSAAFASRTVFGEIQDLTIWFVALNWLPIPAMTGALFAYAASPGLQKAYGRYQNTAITLVFIGLVTGWLNPIVRPVYGLLASWLIR